jgi:hypothetical protein
MVVRPPTLIIILVLACCQSAVYGFEFKATANAQSRDGFPESTHADVGEDPGLFSRKTFFSKAAQIAILPTSLMLFPGDANAAAPITEKETDSLGVLARRALRPKPPKLLRRKLSQDFAVLLMRASYNALDQLDCVAMVRV